MKRTLSLLVALALLLACSGAPLSAAAAPLDGADLPPVFSQNNVAPEYPEAAPAAVALPENAVHAPELDKVLNVTDGTLEFYTPAEAEDGYYPWAAEEGYAKSTNQGVDSWYVDSTYTIPSASVVNTTVETEEGEILYFRYRVSSESADRLRFYVDGQQVRSWSGEVDWAVYFYQLEAGTHVLQWEYTKDAGTAELEDTAYLDDVYVGAPKAVTGVEIQETASVAGYRRVQLTWDVLPDVAFNREVTFTSSDESIATVDENGVVTGVTQGEAVITATTKDGGFTDTCQVSVTGDQMPVQIYGFVDTLFAGIINGLPAFRSMAHWYTFSDVYPGQPQQLGMMPDSTADARVNILCAELVDDTVYGYTMDGRFFAMDLDSLQRGEPSVEYKDVPQNDDFFFYPAEMAYDHSNDVMYVVNALHDLYEVDLETGEIDLDSGRPIYGELPGADGIVARGMDYILGFAIDLDGNAYVMIAGFGAAWGGNGCSRLASLDLETGEYTVIGQTTAQAYQEQSMCFDPNTGKLYWAQWATIYDSEVMNLFIVDTETAALEDCGRVGEYGAHVLGMFIPLCKHDSNVKAVEEKAATCTEEGHTAYWQCQTCGKYFADEALIEEISWEDTITPALGHKTELRNAKEATCTEDGYTGDEVCTVCGEIMKQGEVIPAHCPSKAFADLNTDRWYHEYTDYVIAQELMNGMDETHFAPEGNLTRGMLVTTLYRLAGEPEVAEAATFTDVKAGRYYAEAVAWAEDLGIAKGMTATAFQPEGTVTRQQAATFLYRYVTEYLKQEAVEGADLTGFADGGKVQDYAKTAMSWAVAEGFFEGYGDGTLRPRASLTRAQMAKLLTILDQNF